MDRIAKWKINLHKTIKRANRLLAAISEHDTRYIELMNHPVVRLVDETKELRWEKDRCSWIRFRGVTYRLYTPLQRMYCLELLEQRIHGPGILRVETVLEKICASETTKPVNIFRSSTAYGEIVHVADGFTWVGSREF